MHEATWLKLMRTSFVLLCLIPSLGVLGWAAWEQASFRTLAWEHTLRPSLGLIVRMDRVSHPKPGQTRFEGIQLFDPETRERVAAIPRLDVTEAARGWKLHASQMDVTTERTMHLWRVWHDGILREDLLDGRDADLTIDRVSFTREHMTDTMSSHTTARPFSPNDDLPQEQSASALQGIEWRNVRWTSELAEAQRRSRLEFNWLDTSVVPHSLEKIDASRDKSAEPTRPTTEEASKNDPRPAHEKSPATISVTMRRVNENGTQQTHLYLDTNSSHLPLTWIAEWLNSPLPSAVDLHGTLQMVLQGTAWNGQLKGQLTNIELAHWSHDRIPYTIAGSGQLDLVKCNFGNGGIQDAWGKLKIDDGSFDRRLFEALIRNKLANSGPAFQQSADQAQLTGVRTELTFHLNQFGFNTAGERGSLDLASNEQGVLLMHRAGGKHLDALVRAIVYPASESSIDESQKLWKVAYRLKQWLPSLPPEIERKSSPR